MPNPDAATHRVWAIWAADCAERVLPVFETARPTDPRPRRAVEAARAWADGRIPCGDARSAAFASHAAARDANGAGAVAAARAAGHAAATAHMVRHALQAANYAAKAAADPGSERIWQAARRPSGTI